MDSNTVVVEEQVEETTKEEMVEVVTEIAGRTSRQVQNQPRSFTSLGQID